MDHSYFRDKVSGYYDQGLSPEEQFMMEEHVSGCEECQAILAEYRRLDKLIEAKGDLSGGDYWEEAAQKVEARLGFSEETPAKVTDIKKGRNGLGWKIIGVAASVALLVFIGVHQTDIMPGAPATDEVSREAPRSINTVPDFQKSAPTPEEHEIVVESTVQADLQESLVTGHDQNEDVLTKDVLLSNASESVGKAKPAVEETGFMAPRDVVESSGEGEVDVEMLLKADSDVKISVTVEADRIIKDELSPQAESIVTAARAAETEQPRKKGTDDVVLNAPAVVSAAQDQVDEVAVDKAKTEAHQVKRHDRAPDFIRGGAESTWADDTAQVREVAKRGVYITQGNGVLDGFPTDLSSQPADESPDTLGLNYWREVRDSLKAQLNEHTKQSSSAAPQKDNLQTLQSESSTEPPELKEQRQRDRAKYFEAVYMVARLTDDTDEYYRSLNILSAYLEEFEAPLREVVKGYVKELGE